MKTPIGSLEEARQFSWRASTISVVIYFAGLAVVANMTGNQTATYIGYALIAVGAIALAAAVVDAISRVVADLKIAIILAVLGVAAYTIWVKFSPLI